MKAINTYFVFLPFALLSACGEVVKEIPQESLFQSATQSVTYSAFGDDKGNGGDAVVCFKNASQRNLFQKNFIDYQSGSNQKNPLDDMEGLDSVQMLDVYEYQLPSGFPPQNKKIIKLQGDLNTRAEWIIDRSSQKSGLADALKQALIDLPLENWRAAEGVVEINDSNEAVLLPPQCLLMQIAVRQESVVYYNKKLVDRLDSDNQFALFIHELVYKIAKDQQMRNSRSTRKTVGLLLSDNETWNSLPATKLYKEFLQLGTNFDFP